MQNNGTSNAAILITGVALTICYTLLYELNINIIGAFINTGVASLVFLPAFVRLLGFLLIGLWAIPFLALAAVLSLDLGLSIAPQLIIAVCLEFGAPFALAISGRAFPIELKMKYITGRQLFALSLVAALGSAVTYHIGLSLVGLETYSVWSFATAVVGNTAGTWAIFYAIKVTLTVFGKAFSKGG